MQTRLETDPRKFIRWFSIEGFVASIVILVAISQSVLTLIGFIPVDAPKLIAVNIAILSVLASLSAANLVRLANQAQAIKDVSEQSKRKDLAAFVLKRRQERPTLEQLVQGAKRVVICDAFLSSIQIEPHLIVRLLENRCDVCVVVLSPNDEELLVTMSMLSSLEPLSNLRYVLQAAINTIVSVRQQHSGVVASSKQHNGTLQLMYFKSFMPFAGVLVEGMSETESKVLIELCPFKYDEIKIHRHHFLLEKKNTPDLFDTYKATLEQMISGSELEAQTK